jgi:hypothetical protein
MAEGLRIMSTNPAHAGKTIVIQDHARIMGHNGQPKTMRADGRVFPSVLLAPDGSEHAVAPIATPVSF